MVELKKSRGRNTEGHTVSIRAATQNSASEVAASGDPIDCQHSPLPALHLAIDNLHTHTQIYNRYCTLSRGNIDETQNGFWPVTM